MTNLPFLLFNSFGFPSFILSAMIFVFIYELLFFLKQNDEQ